MEDPTAEEASLSVRFTTQLPQLKATDAAIQLPIRLSRAGLSEVVNHLITAENGEHTVRPFDFLLDGVLIRGSLGQAAAKAGLTGEAIVQLEYVECMPPPTMEESFAHEDWIGGLTAHPGGARLLLAACYNGSAYVWDSDGTRLAELPGHAAAVKSVAWLRGASSGESNGGGAPQVLRAASGSKDHVVRTWRLSVEGASGGSGGSGKKAAGGGGARKVTAECEACLVGHSASVESLAANPAGDTLVSGAWDGSINVWSVADAAGAAGGADPASKRAKGKRGEATPAAAPAPELHPAVTLNGHQGAVHALCWPTAGLLYSGGWDGTIREWQVETESITATLAGQPAVMSIDVSLAAALIASAHTDHTLRLWDSRLQQAALRLQLPHPNWVSEVAWCPHAQHLLASACYDGTVRLWDVRSNIPLHELKAHPNNKALCVAWDGPERLASGGSDAQIRTASVAALAGA